MKTGCFCVETPQTLKEQPAVAAVLAMTTALEKVINVRMWQSLHYRTIKMNRKSN